MCLDVRQNEAPLDAEKVHHFARDVARRKKKRSVCEWRRAGWS